MVFVANFRPDCIIDANCVEAVGESLQQLADFKVFIKMLSNNIDTLQIVQEILP